MKSLENLVNKVNKSLKSLAFTGLIGLALAGGAREAKADVNSNSIVQDNIEYYMQTDKSVYDLGENVEMLYRVTNLGSEDVGFDFIDQVQYHFEVKENIGEVIWFEPKLGLPAFSHFVLQPNTYKEYSENWVMINENGTPFWPDDDFLTDRGNYEVRGSLYFCDYDKYVPVSVFIDVIPEPSTLALLGVGLGALNYMKRKGRNQK